MIVGFGSVETVLFFFFIVRFKNIFSNTFETVQSNILQFFFTFQFYLLAQLEECKMYHILWIITG